MCGVGMETGQVQGRFFYDRTQSMGPYPLPEPGPFNKWFFFFFAPKPALSSHAEFGPNP